MKKTTDINRLLGAATALYGVAIMARPEWLAKPCALPLEPGGRVPRDTSLLVRAFGSRDLVIGLAMVAATGDDARRLATGCRVAADTSDAVIFGTQLPHRQARLKAAGAAISWAALCALSLRSIRS
ncbi:hypothetical protein [Streptomyces sp. MBT27]|uniref:hypothetical protein n=1 Tax=Streptomyces sp. MBT27 TaxID=1488356 RepID=UPI001420E687|nr:hypothetical protein [Streptomyces sp. MBT27]